MSLRARYEGYSGLAKTFHWVVAALVLTTVPIALIMANIGPGPLQNNLYSTHKLIGFCLLWIVLARLAYRVVHGAPPDEPTLEPWQKIVAHINHWSLYALLIVLPILGWIGVSTYPARVLFDGAIVLPEIMAPNQPFAERIFAVHRVLGFVAIALVAMHIGAAFFHFLIRRDRVMHRMLPGRHAAPSVIRGR